MWKEKFVKCRILSSLHKQVMGSLTPPLQSNYHSLVFDMEMRNETILIKM